MLAIALYRGPILAGARASECSEGRGGCRAMAADAPGRQRGQAVEIILSAAIFLCQDFLKLLIPECSPFDPP